MCVCITLTWCTCSTTRTRTHFTCFPGATDSGKMRTRPAATFDWTKTRFSLFFVCGARRARGRRRNFRPLHPGPGRRLHGARGTARAVLLPTAPPITRVFVCLCVRVCILLNPARATNALARPPANAAAACVGFPRFIINGTSSSRVYHHPTRSARRNPPPRQNEKARIDRSEDTCCPAILATDDRRLEACSECHGSVSHSDDFSETTNEKTFSPSTPKCVKRINLVSNVYPVFNNYIAIITIVIRSRKIKPTRQTVSMLICRNNK